MWVRCNNLDEEIIKTSIKGEGTQKYEGRNIEKKEDGDVWEEERI